MIFYYLVKQHEQPTVPTGTFFNIICHIGQENVQHTYTYSINRQSETALYSAIS